MNSVLFLFLLPSLYYYHYCCQHEEEVQASDNAVISPEDLLECVAHDCPMLMRQGKIIEPEHDKTNKMTCASSNDSKESAQSNQSIGCLHEETLGP